MGGVGILDFWIFVFDGPGGRGGLRGSWQSKPHLQKRRFRRVLADFRCFGGALWRAAGRQLGAAGGRGQSASGSRPEAVAPRSVHVVRRSSKHRWFAGPQWPTRLSRGRRSVGLCLCGEAALTHPRRAALSRRAMFLGLAVRARVRVTRACLKSTMSGFFR